ncbi:LssY C-terminal domain-containing protein [Planctomicrobium sp. SH664]|uniref:LssY C-terminal domain-containing protein n=1 Tax=Planctomicrobium sp. SH664 TaxID=3448125 RepID=UPI003F5C1AE1
MSNPSHPDVPTDSEPDPDRRNTLRKVLVGAGLCAAVYLATAYLAAPLWWRRYVHRHPTLDDIPGITTTKSGIPGDPLNVALIGSEEDVIRLMIKAGWYPADPITLKSSLKIAADTVFRRPYDDAPVSSLYLFGRKEDLAFEKPVGDDPKQRNHVRFWKSPTLDSDNRPVWVGAATFDRAVGLSHTTGQITHHISGNIDQERDLLFADLKTTGELADFYSLPDFHKIRTGKNGGGDHWETDGRLDVGIIASGASSP